MTTDEEKYRAYTLNILGLGLTTPIGKIFFGFAGVLKENGMFGVIFYFVISLLLFLLGLTFIEMGRSILYRAERKNAIKYK